MNISQRRWEIWKVGRLEDCDCCVKKLIDVGDNIWRRSDRLGARATALSFC